MNKERVMSSIPRAADDTPSSCPYHKPDQTSTSSSNSNSENWVYPSPQMFWDAMRRKGSLPAHLSDASAPQTQAELDWIVTIHNVVNEQCWQEISKWERFDKEGCSPSGPVKKEAGDIALQRFLGRPNDLSPRAWFKSKLMGAKRPFDRHDWYVRLPDDRIRRYVIDFYTGKADTQSAAGAFYLDVRPAFDDPQSALLRARKFFCDLLSQKKNK